MSTTENTFFESLSRNAKVCIAFVLVMSLSYFIYERKRLEAVRTAGVPVRAQVTSVINARGYSTHFSYIYNGKMYDNKTSQIGHQLNIGDTILIKILPNDPGGEIIYINTLHEKNN